MGNNPVSNFDVLGDIWETQKDADQAAGIDKQLIKKGEALDKKAAKLDSKIGKMYSKGNTNKINRLIDPKIILKIVQIRFINLVKTFRH